MHSSTTLLPTPAPSDILGTPHYYWWRAEDFEGRYGRHQATPSYYLTYGDKYVRRFYSGTREQLSPKGKAWLDRAMLLLQTKLETALMRHPNLEFHENDFNEFAFQSHVYAYVQAGLFDLPLSDLRKILWTLDAKDAVLHPLGIRQIAQVVTRYSEFRLHALLKRVA